MKIAVVGYGKMGQMVAQSALQRGHEVVACVSSKNWDLEALEKADVCIEFTHPEAVLSTINKLAALKKNIVIGTTGWYSQIDLVRSIVNEHQIGALYSPNFSIGVHLMSDLVAYAARLMDQFDDYDVAGIEYHHNQKKDSPSGTALQLARVVEENMTRPDKLSFSSVRCGSIPGTHTILFDSPCDTITLTHSARNREGFSKGAVQAAEWLQGKKGFYTFNDCMKEIIQRRIS